MHRIKRGRGPSAMGVMGSVFAAVFGVFWTIMASSMGAPGFFVAFGVMFVIMAIVGGLYNLYNATAKNRFSEFDVVPGHAEPDPLTPRSTRPASQSTGNSVPAADASGFCPYCGTKLSGDYRFCPSCGKSITATP